MSRSAGQVLQGRPLPGGIAAGPGATAVTARCERGSGTVLVAALAMVALMLIAASVLLVGAAVAASRAASAADLAALGAADAARGLRGGEPCVVAREIALRHGARLNACEMTGPHGHIVTVRTVVATISILPDARGAARAGPPPELAASPAGGAAPAG